MYMGFNSDLVPTTGYVKYTKGLSDAPKYIDWRDYGYVTAVKNQLGCGSCYIFSAIGHIEGIYAKKHNIPAISLSEEQVLDCDPYDLGCFGGYPHGVFEVLGLMEDSNCYLIKQEGLMREDDYPYEGMQGDCMFDSSKMIVNVTGSKFFWDLSEEDMKDAVANQGPISIAMEFTVKMFYIKTGRVYKPTSHDCTHKFLNHAVLIVGYGRDNDDDYWIIKNSWGTHWGDRGYMRIVRGSNACLIGKAVHMGTTEYGPSGPLHACDSPSRGS
ncbi:zingipain-2-like [Zerene cesonia]|uniref:zingipain-2-like n=1 Tax=Zerene cesonia TaxID=33412 RepID=UPI0018E511C0|nr:zingipain-2-like [Zerene cesonia]